MSQIGNVSHSLLEIWRCIYSLHPHINWAKIPDYPTYSRDVVSSIVEKEGEVNWALVNEFDYEYFRVLDVFGERTIGNRNIGIDLSFYDVRSADCYWAHLELDRVVKFL